jgi:hypothetical protein
MLNYQRVLFLVFEAPLFDESHSPLTHDLWSQKETSRMVTLEGDAYGGWDDFETNLSGW